jgi:hypothetical protein
MASTNSSRPRKRSLSDIKSNLMRPATTSHFDVFVREPAGDSEYPWSTFKQENDLGGFSQDLLHLSCSQASLPGSTFMTHEATSDYTGVTERHAYRRQFDGRIDLTFYVMMAPSNVTSAQAVPNRYLPIRFFEGWMKYIAAEDAETIAAENMSYRMRYPKDYYGGLSVIKYERDYESFLNYNFVSAFPIAINTMPVSYESSDLLKCSVTMSYTRYYITDMAGSRTDRTKQSSEPSSSGGFSGSSNFFDEFTPLTSAEINEAFSQDLGFDFSGSQQQTADTNFFDGEPLPFNPF